MFFYSTRLELPVRILSVKITHFNEKIFRPMEENSLLSWDIFPLFIIVSITNPTSTWIRR
ncbi:hypothetical protein LEP1GSC043_1090 [Leptospira weilii str. Ecochallenge]|uniref:Uncharacterized protein n=1 Tax=Leptospira weilii str. Ecochallenge TaxID=1049986 RepID=N1U5J2_9LEPT|nr:hypothetical protein LEP1GSC043_1090 [Leptospira weilii str. Ecochallenge]